MKGDEEIERDQAPTEVKPAENHASTDVDTADHTEQSLNPSTVTFTPTNRSVDEPTTPVLPSSQGSPNVATVPDSEAIKPQPVAKASAPNTTPKPTHTRTKGLRRLLGSKKVPRHLSLSICVPKPILRNAVGNGLYNTSILNIVKKRVRVDARLDGRSDSIFYAPFGTYPELQLLPSGSTRSFRTEVGEEASKMLAARSSTTSEPGATSLDLEEVVALQLSVLPTKTELIPVNPYQRVVPHLVQASDDFEISFVGMSSPPQDPFSIDGNELLLFSLNNNEEQDEDDLIINGGDGDQNKGAGDDFDEGSSSNITRSDRRHRRSRSSRGSSSRRHRHRRSRDSYEESDDDSDLLIKRKDTTVVHYDSNHDGRYVSSTPNCFIPVPASRALYMQRHGRAVRPDSRWFTNQMISVRFSLMEIDKMSSSQTKTLDELNNLTLNSKTLSSTKSSTVLTSAVSVVNSLGRNEIKKYSQPDSLMQKDIEFLVHDERNDERNKRVIGYSTAFLRYGYYFILSEKVDAQLYAQTDSSSQNVNLLLRRSRLSRAAQIRGEKEFFPLSGVPYVVMKVKPGCSKVPQAKREALVAQSKHRIEQILNTNNTLGLLSGIK